MVTKLKTVPNVTTRRESVKGRSVYKADSNRKEVYAINLGPRISLRDISAIERLEFKNKRDRRSSIMGRPHVLVIAFPAQGHVMPMMEFSHNLVDQGFKVTFVYTEVTHKRVVDALSDNSEYEEFIHLVSIPDGMEPWEDRMQVDKFIEAMWKVMPGHFEDLIKKINTSVDKITCIISDQLMGWVFEIAKKMSIASAAFWPASAVLLAVMLHIPKLIEDGILTPEGKVPINQMIKLCPTMPPMNTDHFIWLCVERPSEKKAIFDLNVFNTRCVENTDYLLCNSFYELEPSALTLIPNLKLIGPLFASSRLASFWPEDSACLKWLDQQLPASVLYVAFGSHTVMDKRQFHELALGLELSGINFLWAVRPDMTKENNDVYPDGFETRVGSRGQMVGWVPQRKVLAHPSVGGFFTHCGWNSTMEAVSSGVPLLCCPYFSDQKFNRSYICDVWKIGIGLNPDENGFITKEEIQTKVIEILRDKEIRTSAMKYKEMAKMNISKEGKSAKNFDDFVQEIKSL